MLKTVPTVPTSNLFESNDLSNNYLTKKTMLENLLDVVGCVGSCLKNRVPTVPTEKKRYLTIIQSFNPFVGCWNWKWSFSYLISRVKNAAFRRSKKSKIFWIGLPVKQANENYFFEDGSPIYGRIFWIESKKRLKHRFFTSKMNENHLKMMIKKGMIFCPKIEE